MSREDEIENDLDRFCLSLTPAGELETRYVDGQILGLVKTLGCDVDSYRADRALAVSRIVSELYSQPRVSAAAKMLPSLKCLPGFALDLSTLDEHGRPWDFDIEENRQRAKRMVMEQKPGLLIGTPMCTAFSAWQRINNQRRDPDLVCKEYQRALTHLSFCCELYNIQLQAGRYFLHEHPQQARSWSEKVVQQLLAAPCVGKVTAHQC